MNDLTTITSRRNQRIVEARKLAQRKHRQRQGRFLVEGLTLVEMALDAGAQPIEIFYCPKVLVSERESEVGDRGPAGAPHASALLQRLVAAGGEPVAVSPEVLEALTDRSAPEGIVATFRLVTSDLSDLQIAGGELVVVLDRLQDPGNLGTLIRTADAVGAAAVILVEPCVDPFDPKTVRGTMGSLFNLPLVRTEAVAGLFGWCRHHGLRIVGTDAHRGQDWGEGLWQGGVALVLGNEAHGLSDDISQHVDGWARLPVVGRAESLNVAVAGGVLMYEWLRQRRQN